MSIDKAKATELRKPFPPESIGKLPKGGVMLDYVGHAAVTDRLLTVDPEWTWEPFALDANGLPALDASRNLWIRLTVCGVTRIGVGDGKSLKECIGDAIRNAAMRFGVALDLWAKENLVEFAQAANAAPPSEPPPPNEVEPPPPAPAKTREPLLLNVTSPLAKAMFAALREAETAGAITEQKAFISEVVGRAIASSKELTEAEARRVLDNLPQTLTTTKEN